MPLRVKNIAMGFYDANKVFHPIRKSPDYDPDRVGERPAKRKKAKPAAKKKKTARSARKKSRTPVVLETPAKVAALKKAVKAAKKKKKNPIPTNRYVTAKIRRTRSGDLKVILPLR